MVVPRLGCGACCCCAIHALTTKSRPAKRPAVHSAWLVFLVLKRDRPYFPLHPSFRIAATSEKTILVPDATLCCAVVSHSYLTDTPTTCQVMPMPKHLPNICRSHNAQTRKHTHTRAHKLYSTTKHLTSDSTLPMPRQVGSTCRQSKVHRLGSPRWLARWLVSCASSYFLGHSYGPKLHNLMPG